MSRLIFLSLLIWLYLPAKAEESSRKSLPQYEWKQTSKTYSANGISTFVSRVPGQSIKTFKGITLMPYSRYQILEAMADTARYCDWIYNCKAVDTSIPEDDDGRTLYLKFHGFLFVKDRDVTIKLDVWQDKKNGIIHITSSNFDSGYPKQKGLVRIRKLNSHWQLIEQGPGSTEVHYETFIDLGGNISPWVANIIVNDAPKSTLKKVRQLLESGFYGAEDLDSIATLPDERLRTHFYED